MLTSYDFGWMYSVFPDVTGPSLACKAETDEIATMASAVAAQIATARDLPDLKTEELICVDTNWSVPQNPIHYSKKMADDQGRLRL